MPPTTNAMILNEFGGPDVMQWTACPVEAPGAGEIQLRQAAVGVNYIDVYCRTGAYPLITPPGIVGMEGAGEVTAVGEGVEAFSVGDRVAYGSGPIGGYSEVRNIPASGVVALPDAIDFESAAAIMLQGLTAEYLLYRSYAVQAGDVVLIHAAAGGMGSVLVPWAKGLGAVVIGTVGSAEKAVRAKALGCDLVVNYSEEDFVAAVQQFTEGAGAAVAYDGVGQATVPGSLDSLGIFGRLVTFGNASGKPDPIDTAALGARSLSVVRPSLFHYTADPARLRAMADRLFHAVEQGWVDPTPQHRYALQDAAQAHRDLEARKTTGSIILTV